MAKRNKTMTNNDVQNTTQKNKIRSIKLQKNAFNSYNYI